jgi:hypothetical protein
MIEKGRREVERLKMTDERSKPQTILTELGSFDLARVCVGRISTLFQTAGRRHSKNPGFPSPFWRVLETFGDFWRSKKLDDRKRKRPFPMGIQVRINFTFD